MIMWSAIILGSIGYLMATGNWKDTTERNIEDYIPDMYKNYPNNFKYDLERLKEEDK